MSLLTGLTTGQAKKMGKLPNGKQWDPHAWQGYLLSAPLMHEEWDCLIDTRKKTSVTPETVEVGLDVMNA